MSGSSLADQLLKLGLAKKKPKKKPAHRGSNRKRSPKPAAGDQEISLAAAYGQRARDEQREKEKSAREKRLKQQQRKALNDALAKVIKPTSQNQADAEIDRFFEYGGKIRKIYVTTEQQALLNSGQLGIVSLRGGYHLVSPEVVEKVVEIKPDAVALAPDTADPSTDQQNPRPEPEPSEHAMEQSPGDSG